jgi:2-hydroxychromene-2-carboxylate isomerase
MMLDVYLDLGNVAGLLALESTLRMAEETGTDIRWLPIQGIVPRPLSREPKSNPDDPLSDYKHLRWQAKHKFELAELERDCARLDLPLEYARQAFDATLTHFVWFGLLQANLPPLDYIRRVYQMRFRAGKSLESEADVQALAAEFGVAAEFESLSSAWIQHQDVYQALGIHDSPSYVLNEETFQGRQHLPLIRWRIEGEQGLPPL